jgi:hypothetical protein
MQALRELFSFDDTNSMRGRTSSTLLENLFDMEDASCQTEALANEWQAVWQ